MLQRSTKIAMKEVAGVFPRENKGISRTSLILLMGFPHIPMKIAITVSNHLISIEKKLHGKGFDRTADGTELRHISCNRSGDIRNTYRHVQVWHVLWE